MYIVRLLGVPVRWATDPLFSNRPLRRTVLWFAAMLVLALVKAGILRKGEW